MGGLIVKEVKYKHEEYRLFNYLFINLVIRGYLWRIVTLNIKVSRNKNYLFN